MTMLYSLNNIRSFKDYYFKLYGIWLNDQEAYVIAQNLKTFLSLIEEDRL
jgi:hypothetical protein